MKYVTRSFVLTSVLFLFITFSPRAVFAATAITSCGELQNIPSTGLTGDYVLANDIDCSGIANFSRIGNFSGTLDGQGHTISNLTVDPGFLSDRVALFSSTSGAVIRNLSITNAHIVGYTKVAVLVGEATNTIITNVSVSSGITMFGLGGAGNVGGIVGYADNTLIAYSYAAVPMNVGGSNVGGLVGTAANGSMILKSYSTAQVACTASGGGNVGGLVGVNDSSTIVDSYSSSYMQSGIFWVNSVGGLVGLNTGATALIDRSYSVNGFNINGSPQGLVGTQSNGASTTNSFWDTTVSGLGSSAGGTGKNTSQMQTQGTFVSGWDFSTVWVIGGYPTLRAADVSAPALPSGVTATATGSNVHLSWTNPTDSDFSSVFIQRDTGVSPSTVLAGTRVLSASTSTTYDDVALSDAVYYYSVIAVDSNGNYSMPARISVRVDTTPPSVPTNISATLNAGVVSIGWTNPVDADFASSTIRRSSITYPTTPSDGSGIATGVVGVSYQDTPPADGTYYYSVFALDGTGNASAGGHASIVVDTVLPVLSIVTEVSNYTNDTTPTIVFNSTKAGTITYSGGCASATTTAVVGSNTITFNTLAEGVYSNCTLRVTDSVGNVSLAMPVSQFVVDTTAPVLTSGREVEQNVFAVNAYYTFTTTEEGIYALAGCTGTVDAVGHVVYFRTLLPGTYSCTLVETDFAGNVSNTLTLQTFTIRPAPAGAVVRTVLVSPLSGTLGFAINSVRDISTTEREVSLQLNADPKTVQGYAVSHEPSFVGLGIIPYNPTPTITIPRNTGPATLYLKYYSTTGNATPTFSQTVSVDGVVTQASLDTKISKSAPKLSRTLRSASQGEDVRWLQVFLNTQGYVVAKTGDGSLGKETTYFGPRLTKAVIAYQKAKGIVPSNGVVGPLTRQAIVLDTKQ